MKICFVHTKKKKHCIILKNIWRISLFSLFFFYLTFDFSYPTITKMICHLSSNLIWIENENDQNRHQCRKTTTTNPSMSTIKCCCLFFFIGSICLNLQLVIIIIIIVVVWIYKLETRSSIQKNKFLFNGYKTTMKKTTSIINFKKKHLIIPSYTHKHITRLWILQDFQQEWFEYSLIQMIFFFDFLFLLK